jgi:KaiC/GvpD/RAD55 family RecA-like ATPase
MELLEREPHLNELDRALDLVTGGSGRTVLVFGEAGIGKTVLVDHFVSARISAVLTKMNVRSRAEAITAAHRLGLLSRQ